MKVSIATDAGRVRSQNQDAGFFSATPMGSLDNLFIVADGMGGHNAGDYASTHAIQWMKESIEQDGETEVVAAISRAITTANEKLYIEASRDVAKLGMGTTAVVATIKDNQLYVANVGDSRLYILYEDELQQVTRDHSVIEEMVRKGEVSKEVAQHHPKRNMITRAVGVQPDVRIDIFDLDFTDVQAVVLCSDGLTNMVEEEQILEVLLSDKEVEEKTHQLLQMANEAGGKDNITVLVMEP